MMEKGNRRATVLHIQRGGAFQAKGFEVSFVNRDSGADEPIVLQIHEVELKKLVAGLTDLLSGRTQQTGVEGVYIENRA